MTCWCDYGNKYLGSIKGVVFRDQLSDCQVRKEDSAPKGSYDFDLGN
jgi:hypothetical protein